LLLSIKLFLPGDVKNFSNIKNFKKYGFFIILLILVVTIHLIEVNFIDKLVTEITNLDFTPSIANLEKGFTPYIHNLWNMPLVYFFVAIYIIVYPFTLWFTPLLFIFSDENISMKWFSYGFLVVYILALPFYLFLPITNVYTYLNLQSALNNVIPGIEQFFYATTTQNNCLPSLHVAAALLIAITTWKSKNKRYKYFTTINCILVVISVSYLSIHWITDIAGGIIVVLIAITLLKRFNNIEQEVLDKITPSEEDKKRLKEVTKKILDEVKKEIKKIGVSAEPLIVGSVAKDTFLKDKIDIDVFIQFPKNISREKLEKYGLEIGRKILKEREERYAEHPYVRGKYEDFTVEIVPCYKVKDPTQKLSAVDRTPFHTKYIKMHLPEKLKKDVRLFKQFLRGIGAYGAEAEIEGFSGYLCELLVLKYKGFKKVLKAVQKWKKFETIIKVDEKQKIDKKWFEEAPLIVVDPIDPKRNVASALSEKNFDLFIKAAVAYLKNPSINFFFPSKQEPWSMSKIKKEIEKLKIYFVGIKIVKPNIISDNLYPQIRKALKSIISLCEENDFIVKNAFFYVSNNHVYFVIGVKEKKLSSILVHTGPPDSEKEHVKSFIEKWSNNELAVKGPYLKKGRWYVEIKRKYVDILDLLRDRFSSLSLGKHINQIVKRRGYEILDSNKLIIDELRDFWTNILDKKMPWEK
jgi:tRNA nucleotidyltransferase (CCA-adding enzyme)